jgi:hypothetical protein
MRFIDQQQAALCRTRHPAPAGASVGRTRILVAPAGTTPRGGRVALLILLLAVLAAAEIGASPSLAQVCGKLAEFPCGP